MGRLVCVIVLLAGILAVITCVTTNRCDAGVAEDVVQAQSLFTSGDNNGALAIYEDLIKNQPESRAISMWYYRASWCYWLMNRYPECMAAREKAVELTSNSREKRDWQSESATWWYLIGDYGAALSVLEKLTSEYPKDADCADWYRRMSLCRRLAGDGVGSIDALDRAVELAADPRLKRKLRHDRAIAYSLNGDYVKAEAEYRGLVQDHPDAPDVPYWSRGLSLACWKQKRYQSCFQAMLKAIGSVEDADTKKAWGLGCAVRAYQMGNYGAVVSVLSPIAKDSPNVDLQRLIARSLVNLRDWDKAMVAFGELEKASPECDREWRLWTAYCHEQQGNYGKAVTIYRELIDKYPQDRAISSAYFRMARCLVMQGKAAQALGLLDACYRNKAHKPEALFWKAEILAVEMRNYKEASVVAKKFLAEYPKHAMADEANWLMVSSLLHTDRWNQARTIAENLLEREAANEQGVVDEQNDEALCMFPDTADNAVSKLVSECELAHASRESQARTRYAIGYCCWKKGKRDSAERFMQSIVDRYPDCATAKEARTTLNSWRSANSDLR